LLKVVEVAEVLGVSRTWVYRRIEAGELPVIELGDTQKPAHRRDGPPVDGRSVVRMQDRLLKVAEVTEILGVGIDWVYERIRRGEIPVVELGDTRKNQRVTESDLTDYVRARRR